MHVLAVQNQKLSTMPITDITNKILSDATTEAEHIIAGAKQEAQEIKKQLELQKKEITNKQKKETEKNLLENERRVTSAAYQEVKMQTDKAKRAAIDETFDDTLLALFTLSTEDYEIILKKMLALLPKNISGEVEVITPKEKEKITKKILKELQIKNTITPTDKFNGGVVIIGDKFKYNLTFENILSDKKKLLEVDVAKMLFT